MSPLLENLTHRGDVDLHLVAHMKQERAWVLQSPFNVRNDDVGPCAKTVPFRLYGKSQTDYVVASMQSKNAFNPHIGVSLKFNLAGHFGRRESYLGVALAFEDFCVHFVVAARISAVSAGSIHDYQAAGRAIGWIEVNGPMLERKSAVHSMESGGDRELDPGVRWIEFESHFLRAKRVRAHAKNRN